MGTIRQVATCPSRSQSAVRVGQRWQEPVFVWSRLQADSFPTPLPGPALGDLSVPSHAFAGYLQWARQETDPALSSHLELKPFPTPSEKHIHRDISNLPSSVQKPAAHWCASHFGRKRITQSCLPTDHCAQVSGG